MSNFSESYNDVIKLFMPSFGRTIVILIVFMNIMQAELGASGSASTSQVAVPAHAESAPQSLPARLNGLGFTDLHHAAAVGDCNTISHLLKTRSRREIIDVRTLPYETVIEQKRFPLDEFRRLRVFLFNATPLHIALLYGNMDAATLLLDKGSNIAIRCTKAARELKGPLEIRTSDLIVTLLPLHKADKSFKDGVPASSKPLTAFWEYKSGSFDYIRLKSAVEGAKKSFGDLQMAEYFARNEVISCLLKENGGEAVSDSSHQKIVRHCYTLPKSTDKEKQFQLECQALCCQNQPKKELSLRALDRSSIVLCLGPLIDPGCKATNLCSLKALLPYRGGEKSRIISYEIAAALSKNDPETVSDCTYIALEGMLSEKGLPSNFAKMVMLELRDEILQDIIKRITLAIRLCTLPESALAELGKHTDHFANFLFQKIVAKNVRI